MLYVLSLSAVKGRESPEYSANVVSYPLFSTSDFASAKVNVLPESSVTLTVSAYLPLCVIFILTVALFIFSVVASGSAAVTPVSDDEGFEVAGLVVFFVVDFVVAFVAAFEGEVDFSVAADLVAVVVSLFTVATGCAVVFSVTDLFEEPCSA